MNNQGNQWPNQHPPAPNNTSASSHPFVTQQNGAFTHHTTGLPRNVVIGQTHPPQFSPTHPKSSQTAGNATSHDRSRGHQPPLVSPTVPHPTVNPTHSGIQQHPPALASGHQQYNWVTDGGPPLIGHPPIHNIPPSRNPTNNNPPKCRIPDCTLNAYYDVFEQEQTEFCGQGHELKALSTGLVAYCVICNGRPCRIGERVCGRTCRERELQAPRVSGSYYNEPVVHRGRPS